MAVARKVTMKRRDWVPVEFHEIAESHPDDAIPLINGLTVPGEGVTRLMCELLDLRQAQHVLLIGTGSGYQTAYLAERYGVFVDSVDIRAMVGLAERMPKGVRLFVLDGLAETPQGEVYDAILCTCGIPGPMEIWRDALREGGRCVAPVGPEGSQAVRKYVRVGDDLEDMGDFAYGRFVSGEILTGRGRSISVYDAVEEG